MLPAPPCRAPAARLSPFDAAHIAAVRPTTPIPGGRGGGVRTGWVAVVCLLVGPPALDAQPIAPPPAVEAMQQALVDVIAAREKSVVAIGMFRTNQDPFGDNPFGGPLGRDRGQTPSLDAIPDAYATGVLVDDQGLILTCWHTLKDKHKQTRQYVRLAGEPVWWQVRLRAADPFSDLAVLEIVDAKQVTSQVKLQPMPLGDAGSLRKGQLVITLGNPYAIARDGEASAGWGIVANLRRQAAPQEGQQLPHQRRPGLHHLGTLIQTDAKLNLGTSGGALLNLEGKMVGLTTSLAALEGYEKAAGYAIAVDDTFRRALKLLKEGREVEYGFLGVRLRDLTHQERAAGWYGIRIEGVIDGGPASGRLRPGDIVTHVQGQPILGVSPMMREISRHAPATQLRLTVARPTPERLVPNFASVQLTKKHITAEKVVTIPRPAWRGIRIDYSTASDLLLGAGRIDPGVRIEEVAPHSAGATAQLKVGQRITHVGDVAVNTPAEFWASVGPRQGAVPLRVEPGSLQVSVTANAP